MGLLFLLTLSAVALGVARVVVAAVQHRKILGTADARGPRWPMLAVHAAPVAMVLGFIRYADATGHEDNLGPLMAVACAMAIIQLVAMGMLGLRATVVSFWATAIFAFVELGLATLIFGLTVMG